MAFWSKKTIASYHPSQLLPHSHRIHEIIVESEQNPDAYLYLGDSHYLQDIISQVSHRHWRERASAIWMVGRMRLSPTHSKSRLIFSLSTPAGRSGFRHREAPQGARRTVGFVQKPIAGHRVSETRACAHAVEVTRREHLADEVSCGRINALAPQTAEPVCVEQ